MRLFDTHCHMFMEPLWSNRVEVLHRTRTAGVERLVVPSVDRDSIERCCELGGEPSICAALGVHPWWAGEGVDTVWLQNKLSISGAVAVGEIGLDWKAETPREKQTEVFIRQLELAEELDLPVILHCRAAFQEMLEILSTHSVKGVIHAWSRSPELMERFVQTGLFISFGGAVTRPGARNAGKSAVLVPWDRFVLETDAPSIGMRDIPPGETEPAHITRVALAMAELRGTTPEEIAGAAWRNSEALFGAGE